MVFSQKENTKKMNKSLLTCPICSKEKKQLIKNFLPGLDEPVLEGIKTKKKDWIPDNGICNQCLDEAHQQLLGNLLGERDTNGISVIPTPIRMNTHPDFSGKGVTICFIDSGFYLHPDLEFPQNRIKKILDITEPDRDPEYFRAPHDNAWHGTMTSVVCAGNGHLSEGLYKGIASEAELVLVKVSDEANRISGRNITKALHWVIQNHETYGIRIVNLSVTDDEPTSFKESEVSKAVKELFELGIVVVAAAGNDPNAPILPPASTPEALAVGGLNDCNTLDPLQLTLYHSTFGWTVDGLMKPELIAPAIYLAAPILPQTEAALEAKELFFQYEKEEDTDRKAAFLEKIKNGKFLSPHYQHVDGTSFAAPIVCSVIAQMLEANPQLSPGMVWEILLTTARPLPFEDRSRQGYGVLQAGHAVIRASGEGHLHWMKKSPYIDQENEVICFYFHRHNANEVAVSGSFNNWSEKEHLMLQNHQKDGLWHLKLPFLPEGIYQYKFVVNGREWVSDPMNIYREPDGYNGFNSLFIIQ